jgi:hypothetical protein
MRSYTDATGGNDNLLMLNKSTIAMRVYQQAWGSATAYSSYADVLMTNNYNSYAPTLTGTGASGTWGINITGNAATATTATQVANALTAGSYLTSGGTFTGAAARTFAVDATTTATASKVVARDVNGDDYRRYGFGEYFNMSHAVSGATTDTVFYSSTDNYIRKNNATGLRASLNVPTRSGGDANGTWNINVVGSAGSATNIAGGAAGRIPYNTGSGATSFVAVGTSGQVLQSNGTSAPTWVAISGGAPFSAFGESTASSSGYY